MPYFGDDERYKGLVNLKPMPKKVYEEFGRVDLDSVKAYFESKECDYMLIPSDEIPDTDNPDVRILKAGIRGIRFNYKEYKNIELPFIGVHEPYYLAAAIRMLKDFPIGDPVIKKAVRIAGDYFSVRKASGKPLMFEGPVFDRESAENLTETVKKYGKGSFVMIAGFTSGVDFDSFGELLFKDAFQILTYRLKNHEDALPAYDVGNMIREINPNVTEASSLEEAVELATLLAGESGVIIQIN